MKYALVIFDLDGTILNTLGDLASAVNHALLKNGYPQHTTDDVRRFVGNGVEKLIRRSVPQGTGEAQIMKTLSDFRAYYDLHAADTTRPYPGIRELMCRLRESGTAVAVHSNKYDTAVAELCALHFPNLYDEALGEGTRSPRKPDPTGVYTLMGDCNAERENTIYIGDSEVDLATAANAGVECAWVSWGFRKATEMNIPENVHKFDTPEALQAYLLG